MASTQFQLPLVSFEYEHKLPVRTVTIDGDPWFVARDVCEILGIKNVPDAMTRLDPDEKNTVALNDGIPGNPKKGVISESGLYTLIIRSDKAEARAFRRWITREVLPQIRKTGAYVTPGLTDHTFIRRFNDNWDRVEAGYFSVISELYIRVYGKFEQLGHRIAEKGRDGKEIRPDVSVGKRFPKFLEEKFPAFTRCFKMYRHVFRDGNEVEARQYENQVLPAFIEFVETIWLKECAEDYLNSRDPKALEYLPRLLQAPTSKRRFAEIKDAIASKEDPKPRKARPA